MVCFVCVSMTRVDVFFFINIPKTADIQNRDVFVDRQISRYRPLIYSLVTVYVSSVSQDQ